MNRTATLAFVALTVIAPPRGASAATAVLLENNSVSASVLDSFADTLARELPDVVFIRERRSSSAGRKLSTASAMKAIAGRDVDVVVDTALVSRKRMAVRILDRSRTLLFEDAQQVKGDGKKKAKTMAIAAVRAIRGYTQTLTQPEAEPEESASSDSSGADVPPSDDTSPTSASIDVAAPLAAGSSRVFEVPAWAGGVGTVAEVSARFDAPSAQRDLELGVSAGGAIGGYVERLESSSADSRIKLTVPRSLSARANLNLQWRQILGLEADLGAGRTSLATGAAAPAIPISALDVTVMLDYRYGLGPLSLVLGGRREVQSAPAQSPVLLVSSHQRDLALAGMSFRLGDTARDNFSVRLLALAIVLGRQLEVPATSGNKPSFLGGKGEVALRYKLASLVPGLFVEARGAGELLKIVHHGEGTRTGADGITPLKDARQTRLSYSGAFGIGYVM